MTFLAPTAGILALSLSVPALLLFYFLKLRRRPLRVSSTLLWERALHDLQVNAPFRWLRITLLLLLQLAALLSLCAAIARPAVPGGLDASNLVALVIDRSASMSATDAPGPAGAGVSRLDDAKRHARETLARLTRSAGFGAGLGDTRVMVVAFAADARALTPLTSDPAAVREAIDAVTPSDQTGDPQQAMDLLDALRAGSDADTPEPMTVFFFSDGDPGPTASLRPPVNTQVRFIRTPPLSSPPPPPPSAPALQTPAAAPRPDNLGITAISARRDHDDPAQARLFVRLANASEQERSTTLELRIDGVLIQVKPATIPPARDGAPGETGVTFSIENTSGGVALVTVTRPDLLGADNAAALVLDRPGGARVLVVGPGLLAESDDAGADPFLLGALEALELQRLRVVDARNYEAFARADAAGSGVSILDYDLVVFDRVIPDDAPPIPSISFGATIPAPGLAVEPIPGADRWTRVVSWRRNHPIMRHTVLDGVVVDPPMRITTPPGTSPEPLAWGADGPLIVLAHTGSGRGAERSARLLVAFELARSNWGPDVSFLVFLANAVDTLAMRGSADAGAWFRTDQAVEVTPAPGVSRLRVVGPLELTIPVSPDIPGRVSLGVLDRAGVYRVEGAVPAETVLAVNTASPGESGLRASDAVVVAGEPVAAGSGGGTAPREVWHWFVAAAFILLTLEWFLFAWRMRA